MKLEPHKEQQRAAEPAKAQAARLYRIIFSSKFHSDSTALLQRFHSNSTVSLRPSILLQQYDDFHKKANKAGLKHNANINQTPPIKRACKGGTLSNNSGKSLLDARYCFLYISPISILYCYEVDSCLFNYMQSGR